MKHVTETSFIAILPQINILNMRKIFTLLFTLVTAASSIMAQRLITEDFDYAAGQLTDANGGANVSAGVWTTLSGTGKFLTAVDGSLSLTIYQTDPAPDSRHIVLDTVSASAEDIKTLFTSQTSGTVYCSFLINVLTDELLNENSADTAEYFIGFLPSSSSTNYQARVFIRKGATPGTINFGISANSYRSSPISWVSNTYNLNITHLITFSSTFVDGSKNDITKLWVDQPFTSNEPVPQASSAYDAAGSTSENGELGGIGIRQSGSSSSGLGSTPRCRIDAIKISTDWFDATFPVTLKSFTASLQNNTASLKWVTTDETNMKEYVVERKAGNNSYSSITSIAAKNLPGENTYTYLDNNMLSGTNMYRIKMVDKDGTITYSSVQSLLSKVVQQLLVKGNPVKNQLILQHTVASTGATVSIVNANGILVLKQLINPGDMETSINTVKLVSGNYYVIFEQTGLRETKKFVKE